VPDGLVLDDAISTVVVALVDTALRRDESWIEALRAVDAKISQDKNRHLILPIACEDKVLSVLKKTNFIRLDGLRPEEQPEKLVSAVTHELARLLLGKTRDVNNEDFGRLEKSFAPVKLFISHSKHGRDGTIIATELRDHVRKHLPLATFFDSNDIAAGKDFEKEIKANVADSAMVIIHTDTYSDRPWCRKEVLFAKQHGCPVLVINAVTKGEDRAFPYLGNAPTMRWLSESPHRCEIVIDGALREVLRNVYFLEHLKTLKAADLLPKNCVEIGTAPEMLTYRNLLKAEKCNRSQRSVLLYPDPPLGDEELDVLEDLNPSNLSFTTPTASAIQHQPFQSTPPLKGKLVGMSISSSPDLAEQGMGPVHLEDAMVECTRHLLAQGACLAYGGDLRPGGFTNILFELVRTHNRGGSEERIENFLAWPIHLRLDPTMLHEYLDEARFHNLPVPADLGLDEKTYIEPTFDEGRYAWARSLTSMREEMNRKVHARVLLGGQISGYKGKYPGLLEEALLALKADTPLYLIAGFGGCTRVIAEALQGRRHEALTERFHTAIDGLFAGLIERYATDAAQHRTSAIDYSAEFDFLQSKGVSGLNNGLTNEENTTLMMSKNLSQIVYLLLRGLTTSLK